MRSLDAIRLPAPFLPLPDITMEVDEKQRVWIIKRSHLMTSEEEHWYHVFNILF